MIDQSIIFENTDERFNQPNISFGELNKSFINNIIDNDIDVNEDEILALYFLQKPEENNTKTQNFSEIEKIDEKINFKDSCEIDISNIIKDKIQNFSDEEEKIEKKIYSRDNSEIDENNTTKDRSSKNIKINSKKKRNIKVIKTIGNKIFNIVKTKKKNNKKGRLLKNVKRRLCIRYHDKYNEDNIIKKIKTSFIAKTRNYINKEYEIYLNKHKVKKIVKLIKRIPPNISTRIKKENNLKWFDSKLKDIFSDKISSKYSKYPDDYNKNQIEQIYKENEAKNVISILDKKFRDMYNIYSKDIKLEGFLTLENDLKKEREIMEKRHEEGIDNYLEKYQNVAQNLEKIFLGKKSRNYNKNKISK